MKPRFSILTLLGVTALLAIQFAAYASPDTYWPDVAFYMYAAWLMLLAMMACGKTSSTSVFARGALAGYVLFRVLRWEEPGLFSQDHVTVLTWNTEITLSPQGYVLQELESRLAGTFVAFVLGALALLLYRRQERKQKIPPQDIT